MAQPHQKTTQAVIVSQGEFREHQKIENFALFNPDGTPFDFGGASVLTGYVIGSAAAVADTDTVAEAIGKLEARIVVLEP